MIKLFFKSDYLDCTFFFRSTYTFAKKTYIYYDYFFFIINLNKFSYTLSHFIYYNCKNFINFFYNYCVLDNKYLVLDYKNTFFSKFKYLVFTENDLVKYDAFFQLDLSYFKNQLFCFFFF